MDFVAELPNLEQLKSWEVFQDKDYSYLLENLKFHKRILLLGQKKSGISTVYHALINYLHRSYIDPLVTPVLYDVELVDVNNLFNEKVYIYNSSSLCTASFQHSSSSESEIASAISFLSKYFDLILDLRFKAGRRRVIDIYPFL